MLSRAQVKLFYDRLGARQDWQAFYEDPAAEELIAHAEFEKAKLVFEFGCGTGRFAERILAHHLRVPSVMRLADGLNFYYRLRLCSLFYPLSATWRDSSQLLSLSLPPNFHSSEVM